MQCGWLTGTRKAFPAARIRRSQIAKIWDFFDQSPLSPCGNRAVIYKAPNKRLIMCFGEPGLEVLEIHVMGLEIDET